MCWTLGTPGPRLGTCGVREIGKVWAKRNHGIQHCGYNPTE